MKRILILLLLVTIPVALLADGRKVKKAGRDTEAWRYEIETVNVGAQGSVVVKVSSTSKKPHVAANQAMKNAVHGVIFKGTPGKERIPGKRPLLPAGEGSHATFFDSFLKEGGEYARFAALTNRGVVGERDVVKLSRKQYRVSVVVTVNYDDLRKYLETEGIIKSLDAGF